MAKQQVKIKVDPKNLVKIGRLRQIADSLTSTSNYKKSAVKYMLPNFGEEDEKVLELDRTGRSDMEYAKKYKGIIEKTQKKESLRNAIKKAGKEALQELSNEAAQSIVGKRISNK